MIFFIFRLTVSQFRWRVKIIRVKLKKKEMAVI